jgi:uncharacterized RDD family membrane protein YckC
MWLYWEHKKLTENEPPPPLETYERVCKKCCAKLSLHHALLHFLNAAGYRTVAVEFEPKRQIAHFENCPFCFTGVGWYPGKPAPEIEISPEEEMVVEHTQRLSEVISKPQDDPLLRHKRISSVIKRTSEVDAGFVEYLEYDRADIRRKDEAAAGGSKSTVRRRVSDDYELVFPAEGEVAEGSGAGERNRDSDSRLDGIKLTDKLGSDDGFDSIWNVMQADSISANGLAVESIKKGNDAVEIPIDVDPLLDGVPRCPNHDYRNADRECPFCHRRLCRDCMAFVRGVYGCRDCFGDFKIRNMFDIPRNWESEKSIELGPAPVTEGLEWFGLVRIEYEGALATPRHRFIAHLVDFVIAMLVLLPFQYLFLRFPFDTQEEINDAIANWLPQAVRNAIPPVALFAIATLPILTWFFVAVISFFRSRSPGQQLTNLVIVREDGYAPGFLILLIRAIYAIFGVLSLGVLALISYGVGPAASISYLDWLSGYRVVTFSGMRAVHRDERVLRVAAIASAKAGDAHSVQSELDEIPP